MREGWALALTPGGTPPHPAGGGSPTATATATMASLLKGASEVPDPPRQEPEIPPTPPPLEDEPRGAVVG